MNTTQWHILINAIRRHLRLWILFFWTGLIIVAATFLTQLALESMIYGVSHLKRIGDPATIRDECDELEREISSLIRQSRRQNTGSTLTNSSLSDVSRILTESGLILEEFLIEPVRIHAAGNEGNCLIAASGTSAAWGKFLVKMKNRFKSPLLKSATWSTQSWTDWQVHGDLVFGVKQGDGK